MKIMNYVLAIALIFTVGSCSKETAVQDFENEKLVAADFRGRMGQEEEKPQEIFESDLRQYYVLGQIGRLEKEKRILEQKIERGFKILNPRMGENC